MCASDADVSFWRPLWLSFGAVLAYCALARVSATFARKNYALACVSAQNISSRLRFGASTALSLESQPLLFDNSLLEVHRVSCALARVSATFGLLNCALASVSATFVFFDNALARVSATFARTNCALARVLARNMSSRSRFGASIALSLESQPLSSF